LVLRGQVSFEASKPYPNLCNETSISTYAVLVLDQHVVEATDRYQEEYDLNVVKDMYPLLSLRSLASNVEHAVCEVRYLEDSLADACRSESSAKDVLVARYVALLEEAVYVLEVAVTMLAWSYVPMGQSKDILLEVVVQCVFVALRDCVLDAAITPKMLEGWQVVHRQRVFGTNLWF